MSKAEKSRKTHFLQERGRVTLYVPVHRREEWTETFGGAEGNLASHLLDLVKREALPHDARRTIRGLLALLNELKSTFFNTESKFRQFIEILQRHVSIDDLANLEVLVNG